MFAAIAKSTEIPQGFKDVLFAEVSNAVNYTAYRLHKEFGHELEYASETLAYVGIPDLRYNIVFYAAVKCGYKVCQTLPEFRG